MGGGLHEECPLGKLAKPSFSLDFKGWRQAVDETRRFHNGSCTPSPPTAYCCTSAGSRSHRDSKSGRGLPMTSFKPSVNRKVKAKASARPIHAVFHSHSFSVHICAFVAVFAIVGPGGKMRAMTAVRIAGMISAIVTRTPVEIFSCST